ncbi:MAG: hypothetical protein AB1457_18690 [Chloroflexota bacterium]
MCDPNDSVGKNVLSNEQLTRRLIELEQKVSRLENVLSPRMTWSVSQDELAETNVVDEEE